MDMVVIMCSWIKLSVCGFRSCLPKRIWPSTSFLPKVACHGQLCPISSTAPIRQWSWELSTKCARDLKLASMSFSAPPFSMKQIWNHNTICIGYRPIGRYPFLVGRDSVTEDIRISNCVLLPAAAIGSVPLNSVDTSILTLFYDTCVIRDTVPIPVEEDNHSRFRCDAPICPLVSGFEPLHTGTASSKLWNDSI